MLPAASMNARAILAGFFTAACAISPPPSPSELSPNSNSTPVVSQIRVSTFDTAFRTLPGARVEIVGSADSGTAQTTGSTGDAIFSGSFSGGVTVQATKDGYLPVTRTLDLRTSS